MKRNPNYIDIEIDELTDSIVCSKTGTHFETDVQQVTMKEWGLIRKVKGWRFDWRLELSYEDRSVYALFKKQEPGLIQGLVSFTGDPDNYYMHLIENAPFNFGKKKAYEGVAGNLVAYVCKLSKDAGLKGEISFLSKTKLVNHYIKTLGPSRLYSNKLAIFEEAAKLLIDKYFK
ncbi:hypothetical protein CLV59_101457 [Chitinophaga dinghuensis]|uniref:N-acetyltransferase domain-containing protein n=1 Tax=Chitinophaga dinghuensis TaxID=1539050 RepID=A0A327WE66_9BACT|nr:hypothetical protein [Chitinophaga dinghuensis]RAJ87696.1 hypothetical protein CLV59_101457 [Chitinophaga dinghuensis]